MRDIIERSNITASQKRRFINDVYKSPKSKKNAAPLFEDNIAILKQGIIAVDDSIAKIHNEIKRISNKSDSEVNKDKLLLKNTIAKYEEKQKEFELMKKLKTLYI